jgi:glycyl-tRNA synthetase
MQICGIKKSMDLMEKIVSLCKRRGFVYPGSEIYGGLANTWDYGPLGVELKNNLKRYWWKTFVQDREDIFGLDGGILLNPKIWEASGHIQGFIDALVECKECHKRFRVDQIEGTTRCPECGGDFTAPKKFTPMFKTFIGPTEDSASMAYLRPETAQAIFVNFGNILNSFHPRIPFGIAQVGKAFRNEITLGNFIFRDLEFEQMEIEYFIEEKDWEKYFGQWKDSMEEWMISAGVKKENLRWRKHSQEELSHYSQRTEDLEYNFPLGGFKELCGLAYRTDYDLKNHAKFSGRDLSYKDQESGASFYPHVVEPSFGLERALLAILLSSYREDKNRIIMQFKPQIAPVKVAVFPLLANKPELVKLARLVFNKLKNSFHSTWDDRGNIGKRYYAQDEIGTPWCITIDFQSLKDKTVTVRDRDTTKQERVGVDKLEEYFYKLLM